MLTTAALLFESAASRLTLATENYARGPRIAFLVQLLAGTALFIIATKVTDSNELLLIGSMLSTLYCLVVGALVATDRDGLASTLESQRGSLFAPGAYRGLLVVLIGLVLSAAMFVAAATTLEVQASDLRVMIAAPAFALLYLCLPQIIGRLLPRGSTQPVVMVRSISVGLLVLGSGLPPLLGLLFAKPNSVPLNLFNPVIGLVNIGKSATHLESVVVWAVAVVATGIALRMLRNRDA
jgi:hypothetical protein